MGHLDHWRSRQLRKSQFLAYIIISLCFSVLVHIYKYICFFLILFYLLAGWQRWSLSWSSGSSDLNYRRLKKYWTACVLLSKAEAFRSRKQQADSIVYLSGAPSCLHRHSDSTRGGIVLDVCIVVFFGPVWGHTGAKLSEVEMGIFASQTRLNSHTESDFHLECTTSGGCRISILIITTRGNGLLYTITTTTLRFSPEPFFQI